jgi:hypothetical protein
MRRLLSFVTYAETEGARQLRVAYVDENEMGHSGLVQIALDPNVGEQAALVQLLRDAADAVESGLAETTPLS